MTTVVQSGGTLTLDSSTTTTTLYDGTLIQLTGVPATLSVKGGTYDLRSTGTIATACTVESKGRFLRTKDSRALTITPLVNLYQGAQFRDGNASLTLTAGFKTNGCRLQDCVIDLGTNRTYTVT